MLDQLLQTGARTIQRDGNHAARTAQQLCDLGVAVVMCVAKNQDLCGFWIELRKSLHEPLLELRGRIRRRDLKDRCSRLRVGNEYVAASRFHRVQGEIDRGAIQVGFRSFSQAFWESKPEQLQKQTLHDVLC